MRRIVGIGQGVADAQVLHAADVRDDEADLARPQRFSRHLVRGEMPQAHDFAVLGGAHQAHFHALAQLSAKHPHESDDAFVDIVPAIENQGARRGLDRHLRRRDALHNRFEGFIDADALLRARKDRVLGRETDSLLNLMLGARDIGARQINLVDDGNDFEPVVERHIDVREGLRLDALARIDHQQRALARGETARNLIGKIDMPGSINKIQDVGLAVFRGVAEPDRARLDGDAALALEVHRIEELFLELALRERAGALQQPIGQRRLAVIDMRDNRKISNESGISHLLVRRISDL